MSSINECQGTIGRTLEKLIQEGAKICLAEDLKAICDKLAKENINDLKEIISFFNGTSNLSTIFGKITPLKPDLSEKEQIRPRTIAVLQDGEWLTFEAENATPNKVNKVTGKLDETKKTIHLKTIIKQINVLPAVKLLCQIFQNGRTDANFGMLGVPVIRYNRDDFDENTATDMQKELLSQLDQILAYINTHATKA